MSIHQPRNIHDQVLQNATTNRVIYGMAESIQALDQEETLTIELERIVLGRKQGEKHESDSFANSMRGRYSTFIYP